jgi:UDP-glucose 4-epimerase
MKEKEFSFIENKKILITGASGFIGSYLSELCYNNGAKLFGIDINKPHNYNVWQDFNDSGLNEESLTLLMMHHDFDFIYHLAGSASVPLSFKAPYQDFDSLLPPTLALLNCIKKYCPRAKLITFSSAAVYGNPEFLPINENSIKNPISPYGIHKALNENLIDYYSMFYEIDCSIIRIFSAFGEGLRKQLFWDVMKKYEQDNTKINLFGTGFETRDFIHVKDVVRAAVHISNLKNNNFYNVYNVASGMETSILNAVSFLFSSQNSKPKIIFEGQNIKGNPVNWRADISKLQKTGFKINYPIDIELKKYFNWYINSYEE